MGSSIEHFAFMMKNELKNEKKTTRQIQFHAMFNKISENENSRNRLVRFVFKLKHFMFQMIANDVFLLISFFQNGNEFYAVLF